MRRRLLLSTALISLTAVLVLGLPLGVVGSRLVGQRATERLERVADEASAALAEAPAGRRPSAAQLSRLAGPGRRLEVVLPDGARVAGGVPLRADAIRVRAGTGGSVEVVAAGPRGDIRGEQAKVWLAVALAALLAVLVAVGLALLQSRRIARPLEALAERADGVGRDGGPPSSPLSGLDELDRVTSALDRSDLRVRDTLRRERELSANASHQLRTPLAGLRMRLEELQLLAGSPAARSEAGAALGQADRLLHTIEALEHHARADETDAHARLELGDVVRAHVADGWAARYAAAGRRLEVRTVPGAARIADEVVRQVLDVLLDNALHHGRGDVSVSVSRGDDALLLAVQDAGALGIDRPFDRGRSGREGTGIGLTIARELMAAAGGDLRVVAQAPTCFQAAVPRAGVASDR